MPDPLGKVNQAFLCNAHKIAFIPETMWRDGLAGSRSSMMMKVFVLAVIGAACASVAFAGEVKQIKVVPPVVKATTMSDADMDKVTAGFNIGQQARDNPGWDRNIGVSDGNFVFPRGQCNKPGVAGLC
jgi:hypothetical protein